MKISMFAICLVATISAISICVGQEASKSPKGWGKWGKFAPCSVTCGKGERVRLRTCKAKKCNGKSKHTIPCSKKKCTTDKWEKWSAFGSCSKTCGGGIKTRTRICDGKDCVGKNEVMKKCNAIKCKGRWGPWQPPTSCSKSCGGGVRTRTRKCLNKSCVGPHTKRFECATKVCPAPSIWGGWGNFAPCTKSCGTGVKVRRRVCKTKTCRGPAVQTGSCKTQPCHGDWSPCTKSCATGTRFRFDSASCFNPGKSRCFRTFEECNTQPCPPETCIGSTQLRYGLTHSCCPKYGTRRIINGKEAEITQWPWMVLVEIHTATICGGSLIHARWVLTAAHCTDALGSVGAAGVKVYSGIRKYSEKFTAVPHSVEKITTHPNHKNLENDLSLLKLRTGVDISSDKVSVISLPSAEETPQDSTCFATGWGLTDPSGFRPSDSLMEVNVQIFDPAVCHKKYQNQSEVEEYVLKTSKLICAGSLTKANDACMGDSGGPLVCQRCSSCDWYLAGVTSFGPVGNCGVAGHPGMYSKVKGFESWIHSNIPSLKGTRKSCDHKYGP